KQNVFVSHPAAQPFGHTTEQPLRHTTEQPFGHPAEQPFGHTTEQPLRHTTEQVFYHFQLLSINYRNTQFAVITTKRKLEYLKIGKLKYFNMTLPTKKERQAARNPTARPRLEAENLREANEKMQKIHPDVETVVFYDCDAVINHDVIGHCEISGLSIFEGDDFLHDSEGVMWLKSEDAK
ncbi:MAG: hypothetical protein WC341_17750, partial [Bacteroidales bacterium]